MKRIALTSLLVGLCGCASLHFRADDSTGTKVAKGIARVPVAILTLGLSEGWHARERTMESWVGGSESNLIMAWGPPAGEYPDANGGKVVVFTEQRMSVSPGYANTTTTGSATGYAYGNTAYAYGQAQSTTTYIPPQVHQWQVFRAFRINSFGTIVGYSWRGL